MSDIARSLDRLTSTIIRELKRGGWSRKHPGKRADLLVAGGYRAVVAPHQANERSIKARKAKRLFEGGALWNSVKSRLRDFHSPEQISRILGRMNLGDNRHFR